MPVNITARKTEIDQGLQDLVIKKTRKLKKYFDKVEKIDVVFSAEKIRRHCEITVHGAPGTYNAQAENGDERAAFEKALKAISRQIRESKEKMIDRKRKSVNYDKAASELALEETPEVEQASAG